MDARRGDPSLLPSAIRSQVGRILTDVRFARAKQLRTLLEFLVTETLNGSAERLKEYAIAVEVLGREPGFDPATDNIVRVEARRLRSKLDQYYRTVGFLDPVRIEIPKGAYIPKFSAKSCRGTDVEGCFVADRFMLRCATETPAGMLFRALDTNNGREHWFWLSAALGEPEHSEALRSAQRAGAISNPNVASVQHTGAFSSRIFTAFTASDAVLLRLTPVTGADIAAIRRPLMEAIRSVHDAGLGCGPLGDHNFMAEMVNGSIRPLLVLTTPHRLNGQDIARDYEAAAALLSNLVPREPAAARPPKNIAARAPISAVPKKLAAALCASIFLIAFVVSLASYGSQFTRDPRAAKQARPLRLAILPFSNSEDDAASKELSKALAERVGERLGQLPEVRLVPLSSFPEAQFDGIAQNARAGLGADHVLEGTVSRSQEKIRIAVRMTRLADLADVWSGRYSGTRDQLVGLAAQISEDAAKSMQAEALRPATPVPNFRPTRNLKASRMRRMAHSVAMDFLNDKSANQWKKSEEMLRQAIDLDPSYVEAITDLGFLYWNAAFPPTPDQNALLDKAETSYRRAIEIDPANATAMSSLGKILFFRNKREPGFALIRRALAMDGSDVQAHLALSDAYLGMGFWESALHEVDNNGVDLWVGVRDSHRIWIHLYLEDPDRAADELETLPVSSMSRKINLAYSLIYRGRYDDAERTLRPTVSEPGRGPVDPVDAMLGLISTERGNRQAGVQALARIRPGIRSGDVGLQLEAALNDRRRFLSDLPDHPLQMNYRWLITQPRLRRFADEPRFRALIGDLFRRWQQDLRRLGPSLPVQPPDLMTPDEYFGTFTRDS